MKNYHILLLVLFLFCFKLSKSQHFSKEIDSMIIVSEKQDNKEKLKTYNKICWEIRDISSHEGIKYGTKAIKLGEKLNYTYEITQAYNFIGVNYRNNGNFVKALAYYNKAIEFSQKYNYKDQEAYGYTNLGNIFLLQENYENAIEMLLIATKFAKEIKDTSILTYTTTYLGQAYLGIKELEKAKSCFEQCFKLRQNTKDLQQYALRLKKLFGDIYFEKGQYDSAKINYYNCLVNEEIINSVSIISDIYYQLSKIYQIQNETLSALRSAQQSLEYAEKNHTLDKIKLAYGEIANSYFKMKDYENAEKNYKIQMQYFDSVYNEDLIKSMVNFQSTQEKYEKDLEIENQIHKNKIQNLILIAIIIIIVIVIIASILMTFTNNKIKKINQQLDIQKTEITDSIEYAQKIQQAFQPEKEKFASYFSDKFVIYKPKDIISGDFYWQFDNDEYQIIALADCKGDGVSGAFLTALGQTTLQEIANLKINKPNLILQKLEYSIKNIVNKNEIESIETEGIEISIISINKKDNTLEYSGAKIPLYHISNNQLVKYKATQRLIGLNNQETDFNTIKIQLKKDDYIFMCTKGYIKQIGEATKTKLSSNKFQELIEKNQNLPMEKLKEELENYFNNWIGKIKQNHDICVLGFKV
ncbi:MAG: tetratricopeptide repeat protein [Bacteroidales bacterium]|nr:tetratricopeptide repeat protein [Bacteroidales bacterium]